MIHVVEIFFIKGKDVNLASGIVNIMVADNLATLGARASAAVYGVDLVLRK